MTNNNKNKQNRKAIYSLTSKDVKITIYDKNELAEIECDISSCTIIATKSCYEEIAKKEKAFLKRINLLTI